MRSTAQRTNELQPHGTHILIGYSFGGLVALEMAQRLSEQKKDVGLLVLVDAYPHPRYLSAGQRLRLRAQRTKNHILAMRQRTIRGAIPYFVDELEGRSRNAGVHTRGKRVPRGFSSVACADNFAGQAQSLRRLGPLSATGLLWQNKVC
jgi:pimeloyl-ACP methyl ester carboxylesterase